MISSLILSSECGEQIEREALAAMPRECCGLIEGVREFDTVRVHALHAVRNVAEADDRFEIDPAEHFRLLRTARAEGREIVGCYHSHPGGLAEPSEYDRANASDDDFLWLIGALDGEQFAVKAFVLVEGAFREVSLAKKAAA